MRRIILLLAVISLAWSASAQTVLQRLVSPGPLAAAHAKLESNCDACHASFDKTAQSRLCSGCHKDVAADLAGHKGYHGRSREVAAQTCNRCHTDHKGRAARMVRFNPVGFDHTLTDYPLAGAHATVACVSCHRPGAKYRQAPTACFGCHAKDEPHHGALGTRCESCHNDASWKSVRFDHSATRFPLRGAHAPLACKACHANERYKGISTLCVDCHRSDDVHKGALGAQCQSCHSETGWRAMRFNHDATRFPLTGAHTRASCDACHAKGVFKGTPTGCVACHKKDDRHQGQLGPECGACHNTQAWRATGFDHAKTGFPLEGKHAGAKCQECHREPADKVHISKECVACHADKDVHGGQEGARCEQCHNAKAWTGAVRFDHDLTSFPLIGGHQKVACATCHTTRKYKDAPVACVTCHRKDDRHEGRLGGACATCHAPTGWKNWAFDHDRQTRYPLTGAHAGLECEACHTQRNARDLKRSTACIDCHAADDAHQGQFGAECGRCHTTATFRGARAK
jgi:hypothetical protein